MTEELKPCPWEKPGKPHRLDTSQYKALGGVLMTTVRCDSENCPASGRRVTIGIWQDRIECLQVLGNEEDQDVLTAKGKALLEESDG